MVEGAGDLTCSRWREESPTSGTFTGDSRPPVTDVAVGAGKRSPSGGGHCRIPVAYLGFGASRGPLPGVQAWGLSGRTGELPAAIHGFSGTLGGVEASNSVMTGSQDDHSLVAACRAGQTEAFGVLVRRYQDRLFPTISGWWVRRRTHRTSCRTLLCAGSRSSISFMEKARFTPGFTGLPSTWR